MSIQKYAQAHPLKDRKKESKRIREQYEDRVPCICEPSDSTDLQIDKNKFLVPMDLTVGQLNYVLRRRMNLSPDKTLFLFLGTVIPPGAEVIFNLYEKHKSDDGFLYFTFSLENTFGFISNYDSI